MCLIFRSADAAAPADWWPRGQSGAVVVAAERAAAVLDAAIAPEAKEADLRAKFQAGQISIDVYGIRDQVASVIA